jgi:hypothetical protein
MSTLAWVVIGLVAVFVIGGVMLRIAGALLVLLAIAGALLGAGGNAWALIYLLPAGALLWLAGHWHFAWRYRYYKSPLAQRVFQQRLPRLDPTRGWQLHGWDAR